MAEARGAREVVAWDRLGELNEEESSGEGARSQVEGG